MAIYIFKVEESSRGGYIAYDAVEPATRKRIQLGPTMVVGSYPEITDELTNRTGKSTQIQYSPYLGDTFAQDSQTWTYQRNGDTIVIEDMPRTIFRLTATNIVQ